MLERPDDSGVVESQGNDFTQTLRVLSKKTTGTFDPSGQNSTRHRALLVCTDKSSQKWGSRWLDQSGFNVSTIADARRALEVLQKAKVEVAVVEAWARTEGGRRLFEDIQTSPAIDVPVIVLCNTNQEVSEAIDAGVYDIARKPFDWQLLARRARVVTRQIRREQEIDELRRSLREALEVANRARRQLRHTESFEPVTGLPNRAKFVDLVDRGMQAANRDGNVLAVAVVGFSRFGIILEALGRSETNAVFEEIASRLNNCVRSAVDTQRQMSGLRTAVVSNIGNGRFALMLTCDQELKALDMLCAEIEQELAAPAVIAGQTIFLSTSTGAAVYPQDSQDAESLLIKAETAMREAKARGAARRFFCSNSEAAAVRRLEIEQGLYRALDRRELKLAYQPINDVMTNRVVAAEALLRWPQKDGSFIGPEEFVPIAEEAGLMGRLGNFVIEETCRQLQAWRRATCDGFTVAINVARSQLMDPNFPDIVARYLRDFELPSRLIDFEISERGALSGNDDAIRQLVQLKSLGVRVSVDDFGTGESSIAYLKDMPIDTLKIDRSYVAQLAADGRDSRMIAAMIALAKQLDLTVVAEGVESQAQLRILQSLSCDRYQGFLYSPAVFADDFCALVDPH